MRYLTVEKHFDAYAHLKEEMTDAFIDMYSFLQSMEMFQFGNDLKRTLKI